MAKILGYKVVEVFEDGKEFTLFKNKDRYTCWVWKENNSDCTNALRIGNSKLVIKAIIQY